MKTSHQYRFIVGFLFVLATIVYASSHLKIGELSPIVLDAVTPYVDDTHKVDTNDFVSYRFSVPVAATATITISSVSNDVYFRYSDTDYPDGDPDLSEPDSRIAPLTTAAFSSGDIFYVTVFGIVGPSDLTSYTINVVLNTGNTPIANPNSYTVEIGGSITGNVITDAPTDSDPNGDTLTIQSHTSPTGDLNLSSDGAFTYTDTSGSCGTDTFDYTITDGSLTDTAAVTLNIGYLTDAHNKYTVSQINDGTPAFQPLSGNILETYPNDTYNAAAANVSVVSDVSHGTLSMESNGSYTYTPTVGFFGFDTFTYAISYADSTCGYDEANVTIAVNNHCANAIPLIDTTALDFCGHVNDEVTSGEPIYYTITLGADAQLDINLSNLTGSKDLLFDFGPNCGQLLTGDTTSTLDAGADISVVIDRPAGTYYFALQGVHALQETEYNLDICADLNASGGGGMLAYVNQILGINEPGVDYNVDKNITTKIVNKPFGLRINYLDEDGNVADYDGSFGNNQEVDMSIVISKATVLPDGSCYVNPTELALGQAILEENGATDYYVETGDILTIGSAQKQLRISTTSFDYGALFRSATGLNCASSSLQGSLCLVPACFDNSENIRTVFPPAFFPAINTCINGDGSGDAAPCDQNAYNGSCGGKKPDVTIGPIEYNVDLGCAMCLRDAFEGNPCSVDDFAVRPKNFDANLTSGTLLKANQAINLAFKALDENGIPSNNYNENEADANASFTMEIDIADASKVCPQASIAIDPMIDFTNGLDNRNFTFDNVGDFNASLHEINGTEFAIVDADDTNDSQRLITEYNTTITIIPHHFNIDGNLTDRGPHFTYLSNFRDNNTSADREMSATLALYVEAVDWNNTVLSNYIGSCYAYDTNLTLVLDGASSNLAVLPPALTQLLVYDQIENNGTLMTYDLNNTANFPASGNVVLENAAEFFKTAPDPATDTNGSVNVRYLINFDRRANKAGLVNPILIRIDDLNITETGVLPFPPTTGGQNLVSDNDATFYYGRLHAPRYRVDTNNAYLTLYYEVFCSPTGDSSGAATPRICDLRNHTSVLPNRKLSVDDIHWYVNEEHNATFGVVSTIGERSNIDPISISESFSSYAAPVEIWLMHYNLTTYPFKATMQMSTSDHWLLYHIFNSAPTTNDFELEFNTAGSWSGKSPANISVDGNASVNTNRRVEW